MYYATLYLITTEVERLLLFYSFKYVVTKIYLFYFEKWIASLMAIIRQLSI